MESILAYVKRSCLSPWRPWRRRGGVARDGGGGGGDGVLCRCVRVRVSVRLTRRTRSPALFLVAESPGGGDSGGSGRARRGGLARRLGDDISAAIGRHSGRYRQFDRGAPSRVLPLRRLSAGLRCLPALPPVGDRPLFGLTLRSCRRKLLTLYHPSQLQVDRIFCLIEAARSKPCALRLLGSDADAADSIADTAKGGNAAAWTVEPLLNLTARELALPAGHLYAARVAHGRVDLLDVNGTPRLSCPARCVVAYGVLNACFLLQFAGLPDCSGGGRGLVGGQPATAGLLGLVCRGNARRLRSAVARLLLLEGARRGGGGGGCRIGRRWPSDPGPRGATSAARDRCASPAMSLPASYCDLAEG